MVNGQKVWTSSGRYSHWGILMARTDFEAKKHEGISFPVDYEEIPGATEAPFGRYVPNKRLHGLLRDADLEHLLPEEVTAYLEADILSRPKEWLIPLLYEHLLSSLRRAAVRQPSATDHSPCRGAQRKTPTTLSAAGRWRGAKTRATV